jgi:hypothetical protein
MNRSEDLFSSKLLLMRFALEGFTVEEVVAASISKKLIQKAIRYQVK